METISDKIKIFLRREGPAIAASIIRFFINLVVMVIKLIKYLLKSMWEAFRG